MKNWRPDNWEEIRKAESLDSESDIYADVVADTSFEAGADAMMEALFKLAKESPTGTFVIDSNVIHIHP